MGEFLTTVFGALSGGAEQLYDSAYYIFAGYVGYLVVRMRSELASGVPALFRAAVISAFDAIVKPIFDRAVEAGEEAGERAMLEGLSKLEARAKKVVAAYDYVGWLQRATPDWLLSDAKVEALIDAALKRGGMGASGGVKIIVKKGEELLDKIPAPPSTEAA